mmetsp:Transcript_31437/g.38616  ORF Transcript_31437/g.38616 Transcript_31437/m.38616 type:complete len:222 (-) Transcript_31437:127-792(-)
MCSRCHQCGLSISKLRSGARQFPSHQVQALAAGSHAELRPRQRAGGQELGSWASTIAFAIGCRVGPPWGIAPPANLATKSATRRSIVPRTRPHGARLATPPSGRGIRRRATKQDRVVWSIGCWTRTHVSIAVHPFAGRPETPRWSRFPQHSISVVVTSRAWREGSTPAIFEWCHAPTRVALVAAIDITMWIFKGVMPDRSAGWQVPGLFAWNGPFRSLLGA